MSRDNQWWRHKPVVSVTDVIEAGACVVGVFRWVARNDGTISGVAAEYPGYSHIQAAANTNPTVAVFAKDDFDGGLSPPPAKSQFFWNTWFGGVVADFPDREFGSIPLALDCHYDDYDDHDDYDD